MALTTAAQVKKLIDNSESVLITFRSSGKGDALGSAAALSLFLEKHGKTVDVVSSHFHMPKTFHFLEGLAGIKNHLHIDLTDGGTGDIDIDDKETLHVHLEPKQPTHSKQTYDCIFVIDTPDLESIGEIYKNNTDAFYKTPIVNIDYGADNEHFGHINIVNITASSTAEVVYTTLKEINDECIDDTIATNLLAGMIAKTRSFKVNHTKPQALAHASDLMSQGADRKKIITELYQNRSLPVIQLWGKALKYLEYDESLGLVSTIISRKDMREAQAEEYDVIEIINELIVNAPDAKLILALYEHPTEDNIRGILRVERPYDAKLLLTSLGAEGNQANATFTIRDKNLADIQKLIRQQVELTKTA